MDIDREIRKISRALGVEVKLAYHGTTPIMATVDDTEATGAKFTRGLGTESRWKENLKFLHEEVYRERGRKKYREQSGQCALCGRPMNGTSNTEIDHIITRAHGRDDRLQNLRVLDSDCHRRRHQGLIA